MMANGLGGLALLGLKMLAIFMIMSCMSSLLIGVIVGPISFVIGLFEDTLPNSIIFVLTLLLFIVSFVATFSVMSLFMVGICQAVKSFVVTGSLNVLDVFYGFKSDNKVLIIKTLILVSLKVMLFSLACLVPGYIYGYKMLLVPFILTENPDMSPKEIMQLSNEMMNGYKMEYFVQGCLYTIPWMLLGGLLFCCTLYLSVALAWLYFYGILAGFYVIRVRAFNGSGDE